MNAADRSTWLSLGILVVTICLLSLCTGLGGCAATPKITAKKTVIGIGEVTSSAAQFLRSGPCSRARLAAMEEKCVEAKDQVCKPAERCEVLFQLAQTATAAVLSAKFALTYGKTWESKVGAAVLAALALQKAIEAWQ